MEKVKGMTKIKKTKSAVDALPSRDITSYVTKMMLLGNISTMGIPRANIEKAVERYCADNPKVDATKLPLVGVVHGDPVSNAVLKLVKKHCASGDGRCAVFSEDRKSAIVFGKAAKEIVSKLTVDDSTVEKLKTKIKVKASFSLTKKLKCFGGERIADYVANA